MWTPIPVIELELTHLLSDQTGDWGGYREVLALLRWRGTPVASERIPVVEGELSIHHLVETLLDRHLEIISRWALADTLLAKLPPGAETISSVAPPKPEARRSVSIVICTRDRPQDLKLCLESVRALDPEPFEVIVVDNAPQDNETKDVVEAMPGVRYVCEPRRGLDWARNRGISEARGEIVAFADDDVVLDSRWAGALGQAFFRHPAVAAVCGLILPLELATPSQEHFELHGGFGRGYLPKWVHCPVGSGVPWKTLGTGILGSGANMAFRRELFKEVGPFLPALDTGTSTEGGGDLEILYRVLKYGYPILYEPRALCRHRHRRDPKQLAQQIGSWGVATYAMLESVRQNFTDETPNTRRYGLYWGKRLLMRTFSQYLRPARLPRHLRFRELKGALVGRRRYHQAVEEALEIAHEFSSPSEAATPRLPPLPSPRSWDGRVAVRSVDLSVGISSIVDVTDYWTTRVFVWSRGRPLGELDVTNRGLAITPETLVNAMLESRNAVEWLRLAQGTSYADAEGALRAQLRGQLFPGSRGPISSVKTLPRASIVLATCDRPDQLRRCLTSLLSVPNFHAEVIVVDNRPASGLTAPVVRDFPDVVLVEEARQGLSYARNAGFLHATGEIIICTDDDVLFADNWFGSLLAPFERGDIDIVCGNVLPLELEAPSQRRFEEYGGLGKGFEPIEVDGTWFFQTWSRAVPTWTLGATANTAFRASLLRDPNVGLFEEALGPGVPSGVGEDTYFFYRALRNGYRLRYEPSAVVWHQHRRTLEELKRQLGAYGSGHVAYHCHTLLEDGDFRAVPQLGRLMSWQAKRVVRAMIARLAGGQAYPLDLVWAELAGNLRGPFSLWSSYQLVARLGRSTSLSAAPATATRGLPQELEPSNDDPTLRRCS